MNAVFFTLTLVTAFAVLGVLGAGLATMARGGENAARRSNKLMRARVYLQGLALLFFALTLLTAGR